MRSNACSKAPRRGANSVRVGLIQNVAGGVVLKLTVEAIEKVGAETFVYGSRQNVTQEVAANPGELPPGEVIVRVPGAVGPAIGERIRAVAARDKLHLFSSDGRKRVEI